MRRDRAAAAAASGPRGRQLILMLLVGLVSVATFMAARTSLLACRAGVGERLRPSRREAVLETQLRDARAQLRAAGLVLPLGFSSTRTFSHATCNVPRRIHQTWKDERIPMELAGYMRSWIRKHRPLGWEHFFWSDKKCRLLVKTTFPQYLELFDALPKSIMRADMIRYLILYEYGGVYADLDFESLRPLDDLFAAHGHSEYGNGGNTTLASAGLPSSGGKARFSAMVGQEPDAHAHILYKLPSMVCNALMISCPGHPFWLEVVDLIQDRFSSGSFKNRVLKLTGPMVLQAALDRRRRGAPARALQSPVMLADPDLFYPSIDIANENLRNNCNKELLAKACTLGRKIRDRNAEAEASTPSKTTKPALSPEQCARRERTCSVLRRAHFQNKKMNRGSFANHHWSHSWLPGYEDRYHMNGYGLGADTCFSMDVATVTGPENVYKKGRRRCGYDNRGWSSGRGFGGRRQDRYGGNSRDPFAWSGRAKLPEFCLADKKQLCRSIKPGGGRTHQCMSENVGEIEDSDCQAFFEKRIAKKQQKQEKGAERDRGELKSGDEN